MIGKEVIVTIDRAMGSIHPSHKDMIYPINYGYVEGVMAADGEWQDAYILGVCEPIESFVGIVIAIIKRRDDVEDKWVVAKEAIYSMEEIKKEVWFTEQYFDSYILM